MKRNNRNWKLLGLSLLLSAAFATPAFANIRSIEINADVDNVDGWTPGVCFLPDFEIENENSDLLHLDIDTEEVANAKPTTPYTLHFTIDADDEIIDDDLKITGTGIRASYVDSVAVDNTSASGRLLVYPFYQLTEPQAVINAGAGTVSWPAVAYAGSYELVINYTTKGGTQKTAHFKTKNTSKDISGYLKSASGGSIGVAVRALAGENDGWIDAEIKDGAGKAVWELISGIDTYKVRIQYTSKSGEAVKKETKVTGNSIDVSTYIASAQDGNVTVTVRGIPAKTSEKYYNIAPSEFSVAENSTETPDTDEYELSNPFELLADYEAVTDGDFAAVSNPNRAYSISGRAADDGNWQRVTYKWQYLVNGTPFNGGWKQIGGNWYYFGQDGYMMTGWLQDQGKWYYLTSQIGNSTGVMLTGTQQINGKTYVFGSDGACQNK